MKICFSLFLLFLFNLSYSQTQEGCPPYYDYQETYTFSNGNTIDICGEKGESESENSSYYSLLFKNKTTTFLELNDYYLHYLEFNGEHILIKQEVFFPDLNDCTNWNSRINSTQKIYTKGKEIIVEDPKPVFTQQNIQQADIDLVLREAVRHKKFDTEWECLIGKLEFIALNGNKKAAYLLLNLELILNDTADGALSEYLNDAQVNVKWHLNY